MAEMMATIIGATFVKRVSVDTPANIRKAKKAIKKAFECQIEGLWYSFVEVLSTCPTN
jgi:2-oxoglutarate ferredoxin oxidoreductase subunit beta